MQKITAIITLFLIIGIVAISGCSSSDNQSSNNITYPDTNQTPAEDNQSSPQTNPEPQQETEQDSQS